MKRASVHARHAPCDGSGASRCRPLRDCERCPKAFFDPLRVSYPRRLFSRREFFAWPDRREAAAKPALRAFARSCVVLSGRRRGYQRQAPNAARVRSVLRSVLIGRARLDVAASPCCGGASHLAPVSTMRSLLRYLFGSNPVYVPGLFRARKCRADLPRLLFLSSDLAAARQAGRVIDLRATCRPRGKSGYNPHFQGSRELGNGIAVSNRANGSRSG